MNELNVVWMYPDILYLHGERANILALGKVGNMLGLKVNVNRLNEYSDKIDFKKADIIIFNTGEIKTMEKIIEVLKTQKEELEEYINLNKMIIFIAQSGIIAAKDTIRRDGTVIEGLGILDMSLVEREMVFGDDFYFKLNDDNETEMIGVQVQLVDTKINSGEPLGTVIYGIGNNDANNKAYEGMKYKNVIFTNALGPVLVKNPWYTEKLIKEAMKNKGEEIEINIDKNDFSIETSSLEAIKEFIKKKGLTTE